MDYITLLDLKSEPFSNSPDPSFFYRSRTYQVCLHNLEISIRLKRGLNIVLGDIGTGKTTLSRALIQQFKSEAELFQFHLILDPTFRSESEFLINLMSGFGIDVPQEDSLFAYKEAIRQFLLTEGVEKKRVIVLIVDEGQKLNDICLELLRGLLNFETNQFKLLQLIIMAQNEFNENIKGKRNLTDRINTIHTLRPFDRKETQEVIEYRLRKAGWKKDTPLFSPEAIEDIYLYSQGYPRRIITLCHHAIIYMLVKNAHVVGPEMVKHAVSQLYDYKGVSYVREGKAPPPLISFWDRFSLKRLSSPVLPAILIFILFLSLLWGTRNMKRVNLAFFNEPEERHVEEVIQVNQPVQMQETDLSTHDEHIEEPEMHVVKEAEEFQEAIEPEEPEPIVVTIKKGDTVYKLARNLYDFEVTGNVLRRIREANPHIEDLDHIEVDDKLFFPDLLNANIDDLLVRDTSKLHM